ncbi:MAG TPA: hypothetical protein PKE06_13260 [Flavilitoribacter sp.]|nr:hypothetical protein [Flavilitoribacter sp.]HMQ90333.1 hypothetical protein [Flavilitoribacter sp.]
MELDKTPGILHVATGDWEVVKELLERFNKAYKKSNLKYLSSEVVDGVMFSYIDAREATVDHVFLFGSSFEARVKELRDKKEIDW